MPALNLKIDQLLLDLKNPRISEASSQREALQRVIADQDMKLAELAETIVEDGLNPMERLLVLRSENQSGKFEVLEGNRRLAALKILTNPTVVTGIDVRPAVQKRLEALARQFDRRGIEPIPCFEVADRTAAKMWIELRHTGENEGRGTVSWSGVASARFRGSDPALQALDFVRTHADLTEDQRELLSDRFPITTLDRLLSTPDVRTQIGVAVKGDKLMTSLPPKEVIKPLRRMVLDLAEKKVRVTELKLKPQMVAYVKGFSKEDTADVSKKGALKSLEDIEAGDFPKAARSKPKRRKQDPSDRKAVVPRGCPLNVTDNRIAEIYKELRTLKTAECPNAIAVLLRVFLELSVDRYMVSHSLPLTFTNKGHVNDKSLKIKVRDAVDHLVVSGAHRKDFQSVIRSLDVASSPLSTDLLNAYVHNKYASPSPRELTAAWDTAQVLFERIWP